MKSEITSNELVVQGIIKEVFFTETEVVFSSGLYERKLIIADIIESKIRDSSSNKQICFFGSNDDFFKVKHEYSFHVRFHRYTIKGKCFFESERNNTLFFSFPDDLVLENLRKADRTKIKSDLSVPVPVFLRTQAFHGEGSFILEDTSSQGYGGTLIVPNSFPIGPGTVVSGQLGVEVELGKLNGEIVSAVLKNDKHQGFEAYRIGIIQKQNIGVQHTSERRRQKRHKASFQLTLESMLHPGQTLILDVDDISITGFSGIPSTGSLISSVPIGSDFKISAEKVKARLVHFSGERLSFQILKRSDEDAISWIRKMTPFVYPGARCSTKNARELYRIFLQAGAVSNQYLKRHILHDNLLVNQTGGGIAESSCIHRWFVGGSSNDADAYISAIRYGNSCWVIGDIAKANGSEINAKDSVKSFFHSFAEFALSEPSIGTLMIFWVKGHPMWEKWHNFLQNESKYLINSETRMQYFRIASTMGKLSASIKVRPLEKEDYLQRLDVLKLLGPNTRNLLKNAFDFDEAGAGSFALAQASEIFERKYLIVETQKSKFLAVVNRTQVGFSINRFMDSLFLFPINFENQLDELEVEINDIAKELASNCNIAFPAARVIYEENLNLPGTEMTCLLLYPRAFLSFV